MNRTGTPDVAAPFEAARLEVRLDAVVANWRECARLSGAPAGSVVKADAYGLGMVPIARALADAGCDTFFVARLEEGITLRPIVPDARIYVLDGAPSQAVSALIAHRLTPVLNSLAEIAAWQSPERRDAAIHIDTGMNRLGLPPDELAVLTAEAKSRLAGLNVVLLMSHLACADDPAHKLNTTQRDRFRAALARLPPTPASLAASAGTLMGKDYAFDLVRPGLGLYGGNPQAGHPNPFRVAARLTGRILQVRRVDCGQSVGYAASYRAGRNVALATVALGYADGLMRVLGNRGKGSIGGFRAPVAGRVSMDLITLDVTDLPEPPRPGDEAEFLGDVISLEELAADSATAPYEILTSLGHRVPRHYGAAR